MNERQCTRRGIVFPVTLLLFFNLYAEVRLPKLVSNGMVLQRDVPVKIWGWACPGELVTLNFMQQEYSAITDSIGNWFVIIQPQTAGGPYSMHIKGLNTITINDILFGDVWVCSGQSNMEIPLKRIEPMYPDEIANSENPEIRYFLVPKRYEFKSSQSDFPYGEWQHINPETAPDISAVPYFFAKELNKKYGIPIGLINASLGGSPIEAWLSEEVLQEFPGHYSEALRFRSDSLITAIQESDKARSDKWYYESWINDEGHKNPDLPWSSPKFNDLSWAVMDIPCYWDDTELGAVNGVVWFRKEISIPESMTGKPARINVGRIVDADSVFINGIYVGSTGYQYPPRRYNIPENLLKSGKNTIVVRVISNIDIGGFVPDKPYEIIAGDEKIDLEGEWKYKLGTTMDPLQTQTFIRWKPMGLYNAMIAPLFNYSGKGVIWYQGESNTYNPEEYSRLFPAMINDWRTKWNQADFPFLYVQLPNFMESSESPQQSNWAEFRQVQLEALSIKNTGMAVTIDIGEWNDIHPLNKEDVGIRLALQAEKIAYGEEEIIYSGPIYKSMKINGNKVIISFDNIGSGLVIRRGDKLDQFAIAGANGKYVWAKAKIEGDKVIVWDENIKHPVSVRYAWSDNPVGGLLYNKEGLPASPFTIKE